MNGRKNLKKSWNIEGHLIYETSKFEIYSTENVVRAIYFLDFYNTRR